MIVAGGRRRPLNVPVVRRTEDTGVVFRLVATSVASAAMVGGVMTAVAAEAEPHRGRDWEIVRTVKDPSRTVELVLIPEGKRKDRDYCDQVARVVCADRAECMVYFWTDRAHIPNSTWMPVEDLAVLIATYQRHPPYDTPKLRFACWLYPTRELGEGEKCFYMPGASIPWKLPWQR
jgi:hypothetical protein